MTGDPQWNRLRGAEFDLHLTSDRLERSQDRSVSSFLEQIGVESFVDGSGSEMRSGDLVDAGVDKELR